MDIFWGWVDDNGIARKVLSYIPDDFSGQLLDVPVSRKGWFTPPFETFGSLKARLEKGYRLDEYHKEGSVVYFKATKK